MKWKIKEQHINKINVLKTRILTWLSSKTNKYRIKDKYVHFFSGLRKKTKKYNSEPANYFYAQIIRIAPRETTIRYNLIM